jgi:hypothetical protein
MGGHAGIQGVVGQISRKLQQLNYPQRYPQLVDIVGGNMWKKWGGREA